jgi:cell division septation protein DedD
MDYNRMISVTGMGGLYELLSSKTDGAIVRSLDDQTTKFVSSRVHSFSHLESIEVYTIQDNVNLVDIFEAMSKSSTALPDPKADNATLKKYFQEVYPDLDFERVYVSDMKKMVKWYASLKKHDVAIKLSAPEAATAPESATEDVAEPIAAITAEPAPVVEEAPKPVKKKKAAPATAGTSDDTAAAAEKPKKTVKKKKTEDPPAE